MAATKKGVDKRHKNTLAKLKGFQRTEDRQNDIEALKKIVKGTKISVLTAIKMTYPNTFKRIRKIQKEEKEFFSSKESRLSSIIHIFLHGDVCRCLECNKAIRNAKRLHDYCMSCHTKTPEHKEALRTAMIARGGYPMQTKRGKRKFNATMKERHGVEWSMQTKEIRDNHSAVLLDRYGITNSGLHPNSVLALAKANSDPKILKQKRLKRRITMSERYGDNWRVDFWKKLSAARYKRKEVVINRKHFICQGYEPIVLQWLVDKGIPVSKIRTNSSRMFTYEEYDDTKDYIPDIVVKTETSRWIIEVKCDFTLGLCKNKSAKSWWLKTKRKSKGVYEAGENFYLVVANSNQVIHVVKNPHLYTRSEMLIKHTKALSRLELSSRHVDLPVLRPYRMIFCNHNFTTVPA